MTTRTVEIAVGLFILLGFLALAVLAMKVSNIGDFGGNSGTYRLKAYFENVGGVKVRAPIRSGGVLVGRVDSISFDSKSYQALVEMSINNQYNTFPLDTSASIFSAGLLGEQYISLEAGAEEDYLLDGDQITLTQSAIILEQAIGQFLFNEANK